MRGMLPVVAACLVASGCVASSQDARSGNPVPLTRERVEISGVDAERALTKALRVLGENNSARFRYTAVATAGAATVAKTTTGAFDLTRQLWHATLTIDADPPSALGEANGGRLNFIGTRKALYLTAPQWPEPDRGRWMRFSPAQVSRAIEGAVPSSEISPGIPLPVHTLDNLTALSATRHDDNVRLTVELPTLAALRFLGVGAQLLHQGGAGNGFRGTATATLRLDRAGHPVLLRLLGRDVTAGVEQLPADARAALPHMQAEAAFERFGDPVLVVIPRGDQLIPLASGERPATADI